MKAIQVSKCGGPEALTLVDLETPEPSPNQAIVQIKAVGVNFIDIYLREGRYPAPLPFVAGQEAAGVVAEVGSDVKTCNRAIVSPIPAFLAAMPSTVQFRRIALSRFPRNWTSGKPRPQCCRA